MLIDTLRRSGETPAHLVVGTLDFRLMTKFIDELGGECLNLCDDSGNTLFHFAVGCVDEHLIYRMIERGANLLSKNYAEVEVAEDADGTEFLPAAAAAADDSVGGGSSRRSSLDWRRRSSLAVQGWQSRSEHSGLAIGGTCALLNGPLGLHSARRSVVVQRLPVQEAMKNGNSKNYFNALRRADFDSLSRTWTPQENEEFLKAHLLAATRELRPDIVRIIFQNIDIEQDVTLLHKVRRPPTKLPSKLWSTSVLFQSLPQAGTEKGGFL